METRLANHVLPRAEAEEITSFNGLAYAIEGLSKLKTPPPRTTLHVCERNVVCPCEPSALCCCDSDVFYSPIGFTWSATSNHQILCQFWFEERLKLNRSKNLRFFTLNEDKETAVLDVVRKHKRDVRIEFPTLQPPRIAFHVTDRRIRINKQSIEFALDYMMYD